MNSWLEDFAFHIGRFPWNCVFGSRTLIAGINCWISVVPPTPEKAAWD